MDLSPANIPAGEPVRRWRLDIAYDGTDFSGWQSQPSGDAVQDFLEKRLAEFAGHPVRAHSAGRTDRGVHAVGQVAHADFAWPHGAEALRKALEAGLPRAILVHRVREVPNTFHARYTALGKRYVYRLHRGPAMPHLARTCWSAPDRPLDLDRMRAAAALLVGRHDFSSFASRGSGDDPDAIDPVKDVWRLDLAARGRWVVFTVEGSGFLYKMVRSLVGALVSVGRHRLDLATIAALLAGEPRGNRYPTAPAEGLTLVRVWYPGERGPRARHPS